ncbi:MAG TPA: MarR family transcriptional regulator, partial [Paraburkholderia sp.]
KMQRRDLQIGLVKALGGGFDATATGLAPAPAAPGDAAASAPANSSINSPASTKTSATSAQAAN